MPAPIRPATPSSTSGCAAQIAYVINDAKARLFVGRRLAAQSRSCAHTCRRGAQIRVGGADDEYEAWLVGHEPDQRAHPCAPGDCFVQLYTSGTTVSRAMSVALRMLAYRGTCRGTRVQRRSRAQVAMPLPRRRHELFADGDQRGARIYDANT